MSIPSFTDGFHGGDPLKPRILILEVRDKERPDGEAIEWIVVERIESYEQHHGSAKVDTASIQLSYQRLSTGGSGHGDQGRFYGSYSRHWNCVSLSASSAGSRGAIFMDLSGMKGQRIGTYLLNEIVRWVKQWPEADVKRIELVSGQAGSDEARNRRNSFYERFGIAFDYTDAEHRAGFSRVMKAGELNQVESWRANIIEHRVDHYLASSHVRTSRLKLELADSERRRKKIADELNVAFRKPLRWALGILYARQSGLLGLSLMVLILASALWYQW
ncbi:MAG: hypothetical protein E7H60_15070 [Pseudomonas oryzihabitans]|jgi:GNAT superfamily N-acetyltransferase|uniref:hypothetical protein n=1 Tax=Pseudomonas TaxID=286 RepID=UPI00119DE989|nr:MULTISPECIES: hypothetical protein [Pseudomonas]MBA1256884.1 hypothetical protein [Pseudomonas psychrotolerans]MDU4057867.1 hypothetical protein [Pseudomonas oryzihabitans]